MTLVRDNGKEDNLFRTKIFNSIQSMDVEKFLECFTPEVQAKLMKDVGENTLKEMLKGQNDASTSSAGEQWADQLKIGEAEQKNVDGNELFNVPLEIKGETGSILVTKYQEHYYMDIRVAETYLPRAADSVTTPD